jgi:transmembrane sensor
MTASKPHVSPQARQEAAEWFVTLREREGEAAAREEFYAWLRKSPDNVHAYLRLTALWEDTALLAHSDLFNPEEILKHARAEPSVTQLRVASGHSLPAERPPTQPDKRWRWVAFAAATCVVLGFALGTWAYVQRGTYATGIGEQRTIALNDGSTVILNADTRARFRFGKRQRDIELLKGRALFKVAHDKARPFVVQTGIATVRAVGTQFDVYAKSAATTVTVIEGSVAVADGAQRGSAALEGLAQHTSGVVLVTAGQQLTLSVPVSVQTDARALQPMAADTSAVTAWTRGKLVFNETPLADVIDEFNRYSTRRLIVEDPRLRSFHVSGEFPSSDPARVVELLRARFNVTVHESDGEIRVSAPDVP